MTRQQFARVRLILELFVDDVDQLVVTYPSMKVFSENINRVLV